jgi:hypothetical protein
MSSNNAKKKGNNIVFNVLSLSGNQKQAICRCLLTSPRMKKYPEKPKPKVSPAKFSFYSPKPAFKRILKNMNLLMHISNEI